MPLTSSTTSRWGSVGGEVVELACGVGIEQHLDECEGQYSEELGRDLESRWFVATVLRAARKSPRSVG